MNSRLVAYGLLGLVIGLALAISLWYFADALLTPGLFVMAMIVLASFMRRGQAPPPDWRFIVGGVLIGYSVFYGLQAVWL